ncbi:MAG: DUF3368 domain-containing protein [Leptospiraceae bacterium]|nr:DUF3368 domain-containing protein [Leptospiraceae bacterium]MCP5493051.1 DUF3368 domain-containing protein [Leptospiraceae bacterium]
MFKYIINSSPIISLSKAGLIFILDNFDIIIPTGVFDEIQSDKHADEAKRFIQNNENKVYDKYIISQELFSWNLGKGETSVIAIAMTMPESIVVLDDGKARKCAKLYDLKTTGTIGLVLLAKEYGFIRNVSDAILSLKNAGLYLSDELIQSVLNSNG